ncbi:mandelate racemase/muconate lactonizing enzyme family protein [Pseudorhodobacter sp. W20_MBD10_FR17]|uniref:mandelate racemase/muconate lactonizing enzyme family protein n=1 Tax=Pseudorhodobacter sp. W20_MBD10_FR17 TaxID=3240266 RepID=UPI003F948545
MSAAIVEKIELLAVGPDGKKVSWSSHLGEMYEAMILVKMQLSNGVEAIAGSTAYTEHEFDMTLFSSASLMAPFVLGRNIHDIPQIYALMRSRYVPLGHLATSLFDIALHDGKAKTLGLPIYQMLGAARDKILAYASSPLLPDDDAYIAYCHHMLGNGYRAIKIHPYCRFEDDLRLVHRLNQEFAGKGIGWMLDADANYSLSEALRMGRVLDAAGWEVLEAPIPDSDFSGYKALADALDTDVICGGNSVPDLRLIQLALQMRSWDRSRFDVTGIGGFTGANEGMAMTRAHGMKCEVQSWGYTLTQAANLHLMLAHTNCDYFEQAAPFEKYEFGAKQVIRPDDEGFVRPSSLPGLGVEMDWDAITPYVYARRTFETK